MRTEKMMERIIDADMRKKIKLCRKREKKKKKQRDTKNS